MSTRKRRSVSGLPQDFFEGGFEPASRIFEGGGENETQERLRFLIKTSIKKAEQLIENSSA